jgi:hypothetical protein
MLAFTVLDHYCKKLGGGGGGRIGSAFASQFYLYRVVQYYYCIKVQSWAYVQFVRLAKLLLTSNTMQQSYSNIT